MDKLLRTLRIIFFIGLSYIIFFVVEGVPIISIISAIHVQNSFKDYFYFYNVICLITYPVLFLVSIIYLRVHYGGVRLLGSTITEVGLLQMFWQNEVQLPNDIIINIQSRIFYDNRYWFGRSFSGINNSSLFMKKIRRGITYIAYWLFIPVMHIFFIILFILVYYVIGMIFIH